MTLIFDGSMRYHTDMLINTDYQANRSANHSDGPLLFAHRGGAQLAPENTQQAFDLGLELGADVIETDVRISADHNILVIHDATVNRTTNGSGKVVDLTLDQLKSLDAGYHSVSVNGMKYRNQGIQLLTLGELLQRYPTTPINIDIKDNSLTAARLVANCITQQNREHDTLVCSFHPRVLAAFRKIAPTVKTAASQIEVGQLYLRHMCTPNRVGLAPYASVQVPLSYRSIPLGTARFVRYVHQLEKNICFWTINDSETIERLLLIGADGIVTDRPDLAIDVFRRLGFKS